MAKEYRVVVLGNDEDPEEWQQALNHLASEGFQWVDRIAMPDGARAVMVREV